MKHFVWILLEDVGEEKLRQAVKRPLTGLRAAPFYGCYIQRPSAALGFDEQPARAQSLETVITLLGAEVVDFPGKTRCCGMPLLTINEPGSLQMVAHHTSDAKEHGADLMVTPCPLCHLNLDGLKPRLRGKSAVTSICRFCICRSYWDWPWAWSRGHSA